MKSSFALMALTTYDAHGSFGSYRSRTCSACSQYVCPASVSEIVCSFSKT